MHEENPYHELDPKKTILERIKHGYHSKTIELALSCHSTDGSPNEWFELPNGLFYRAHTIYLDQDFKSPIGITFDFKNKGEELNISGITFYRRTRENDFNSGSYHTFAELISQRSIINAVNHAQQSIKERWLGNY